MLRKEQPREKKAKLEKEEEERIARKKEEEDRRLEIKERNEATARKNLTPILFVLLAGVIYLALNAD